MKQLTQSMLTGELSLDDVPVPTAAPGMVVIRTMCSLISQGTEKDLVDFASSSLIQKAVRQPHRVKQILEKFRTDGFEQTISSVYRKLNNKNYLGYCNFGVIHEVGADVADFKIGDRVVSNGPHAEFVTVPEKLCASVPDSVSDEEAAFTVLGSIALQGIRLVAPTFGETVVVFGLGLVGLTTVQLLKANGCKVIGIDINRIDLADELLEAGATEVTLAVNGPGYDLSKVKEWISWRDSKE